MVERNMCNAAMRGIVVPPGSSEPPRAGSRIAEGPWPWITTRTWKSLGPRVGAQGEQVLNATSFQTRAALRAHKPKARQLAAKLVVSRQTQHVQPSSGLRDRLIRVTTASQARFSRCGYLRSKQ
jgi:hypothetical protein